MRTCCVPLCNEKDSKSNRNSFHRLPADPVMKQKWLDKINRPEFKPPTFTYICSKHFTESDYEIQFGKRSLKKGIVPSILPSSKKSNVSEQKKRPIILQRSQKNDIIQTEEETIIILNEDESENRMENAESESNRSVNCDSTRKLRYEGDFIVGDMQDPNKAEQYFCFAKKKIVSLSRKAKSVQQINRRLRRKLLDLKLFIEELSENEMISKQATVLLRSIIPEKMLCRADTDDDEDDEMILE